MNAGAYGGEMKDVVAQVNVLTRAGEFSSIPLSECDFSYRHSKFQTEDMIVLGTTLQLVKGKMDDIQSKMAELTHLRQSKQPLEYPSCGSVFKRPEGYFAGKLIQDAGLQGYRVGDAQVSLKHAGFIVNLDKATASDYMAVIHHVQAVILEKEGIVMEPEVRIIGED